MIALEFDVDRLINLVFDGEFEAFTPWWGGNELGYTFYPQPHYPEPKEIIGKTKWAIRAVCGKVPKELGEGGEMASRVKVFVSVVSEGKRYFDFPPEFNEIAKYVRGKRTDVLNAMREQGYSLVFKGYRANVSLDKRFNGLYTLLTIPRFYLRAMGSNFQEMFNFQPMRPGFRIRVKVISRDNKVAGLFVKFMLATLKYLGIGSASNRGFGRFKLSKLYYSAFDLDDDVFKYRLVRKPIKGLIRGRKFEAVGVEGVLSAIGLATLKQSWKSFCGNFMASGRNYHTWVLGLPREVKGKGYISSSARRQSYIVISPTEDLDVLLIPFYAEDYRKIFHQDHGRVEVINLDIQTPNCSTVKGSGKVKDYIDTALDWIETLLR